MDKMEEYLQLKIKWARNGDTSSMGDLFEQWVSANIFPEEFFSLVDYTPRREDLLGRKCETAKNPDFMFRDRSTGEIFWVECKFRSHEISGRLPICEKWRLEGYRRMRSETDMKLFFIVGLGGESHNPKNIFCFDIDGMKWGEPFFKYYAPFKIYSKFFKSLNEMKEHTEKPAPYPNCVLTDKWKLSYRELEDNDRSLYCINPTAYNMEHAEGDESDFSTPAKSEDQIKG